MADHEDAVQQFCSITDASPDVARRFLELHGWNLEAAISSKFESEDVTVSRSRFSSPRFNSSTHRNLDLPLQLHRLASHPVRSLKELFLRHSLCLVNQKCPRRSGLRLFSWRSGIVPALLCCSAAMASAANGGGRGRVRSMAEILAEQEQSENREAKRQEYLTHGAHSAQKIIDPRDRPLDDLAAQIIGGARRPAFAITLPPLLHRKRK